MSELQELSYPLERTSAMRILGQLWSGNISGQILVGFLLFIGVLFMGNQGFNLISVAFFIIFILPMAFILHKRLVSRGRKLMREWCDIKVNKKILQFRTGFPNTMNPEWREIQLQKPQKELVIKGSYGTGFHIRLGSKDRYPTRLGLWLDLDQTKAAAKQLAEIIGGTVTIDIIKEKENNLSKE